MNLNNRFAKCALIALISATPSLASAADGTVTINGNITAASCTATVTGNDGAAVDLGTVSQSSLENLAAESTKVPFKITLTACSSSTPTSVKVYFGGTPDPDDSTLLKASVATGVGIAIYDSASNKIDLGKSSPGATVTSNAATFQLYANYVSTASTLPTVGEANTTATFNINYL